MPPELHLLVESIGHGHLLEVVTACADNTLAGKGIDEGELELMDETIPDSRTALVKKIFFRCLPHVRLVYVELSYYDVVHCCKLVEIMRLFRTVATVIASYVDVHVTLCRCSIGAFVRNVYSPPFGGFKVSKCTTSMRIGDFVKDKFLIKLIFSSML